MIYLKLLVVALVWGGTFIATRIAAQHLEPFAGAFLRFSFACMGLLGLVWGSRKPMPRPDRRAMRYYLILAVSGIIGYNFFFFSALKLIPASRASLLVALNPVLVLFATAALHGEKLRWVKVMSGLLALFGAVVVIARGELNHLFDHFGLGGWFALGCPLSWAVYTLASRQAPAGQSPLMTTTWVCLIGTLGLLPLALWEGLPLAALSPQVWIALIYLGLLGTVLGFVWYAEGIRAIGTTRTAIFNNLVPVFGVVLSVMLLHESVHWSVAAGGALVVAGVAVLNLT